MVLGPTAGPIAAAVREQGHAASPPARRSSSADRFAGLEAYRGIAALLIVVFHAYQYSREGTAPTRYVYEGTWLHILLFDLDAAVVWFFVLSGFLLFLPFARAAIERGGAQSARGFVIRRAIRIIPLYYVAITIVWTLRYTGSAGEWRDLLEHLSFTQIFDGQRIFFTIGPAWSLSVEVIFYLILVAFGPLMYLLGARLTGRGARTALLVGGTAVLIAVSLLYKGWAFFVARIPDTDFPIYFGPLAKLDTFALGMLLAVAVAALAGRVALHGAVLLVLRMASVAVIAATFIFRASSTPVGVYFHTLSGAAFFLLLASTTLGLRQSRWNRSLSHPALQYLGAISYSLYLVHEPLMIELGKRSLLIRRMPGAFPINALVLSILSIIVASVLYHGVERVTMHSRHLFTREGRLVEQYPSEQRRDWP